MQVRERYTVAMLGREIGKKPEIGRGGPRRGVELKCRRRCFFNKAEETRFPRGWICWSSSIERTVGERLLSIPCEAHLYP